LDLVYRKPATHCLRPIPRAPQLSALISLFRGNIIQKVTNSLPEDVGFLVYA
jgi:hypothetical protein